MVTGDLPATPRLSHHARERCAEMQVSTKRAKRIVRSADLRRPARDGAVIATSQDDPAIAVVYVSEGEGERPLITSVVWRTTEKYQREEGGYRVVE